MNKAEKAYREFRTMDELADLDSPVHCMNAAVKLLIVILYIIAVTSFEKYDITGLITMLLFPVVWYRVSNISIGVCFNKLRLIIPLVCLVGIANPFIDRQLWGRFAGINISCGVISMITLAMKGVMCVMTSFLLMATTRIEDACSVFKKIHCPDIIIMLFLMTYRYISVLLEEVGIMTNAYHLRAPGQRGIRVDAWGSFLGQLILRSMDRSQMIYQAMCLRGFNGKYSVREHCISKKDIAIGFITLVLIMMVRFINVAVVIGNIFI